LLLPPIVHLDANTCAGGGNHVFGHAVPGRQQQGRGQSLVDELAPVELVACKPLPRATVAVAQAAHVAVGHQDVDHFFPPFDLIGVVRRSPYQTTLALFTSTVPNTTGTGRPSSAVGASKSLSSAACGWGVL